jgi:5-methylcytosine-specific restriction endonuclease McrA
MRPICQIDGCNDLAHNAGKYKSGKIHYRKVCGFHHTITWHPYLKYRKDYCENIDGRLGYVCTAHIPIKAVLQVDHKNGRPDDNREENLQTLCANCHIYKTLKYKDYSTPGRKTIKQNKHAFECHPA